MSKRMNYGPRFKSGTVGNPVGYDRECDPTTWVGFNPVRYPSSPLQKAFSVAKAHGNGKHGRARVGKLPNGDPPPPKQKGRDEFEKEAAILITEVVARLEFGLAELNLAPPANNNPALINRQRVMRAIHELKMCFSTAERKLKRSGGVRK